MNKKIITTAALCLLLAGFGADCRAQDKPFELVYTKQTLKKTPARNINILTNLKDEVKKYVYDIKGKEDIISFINLNKDLCESRFLWKGKNIEPKDISKISIIKTVTVRKDIVAGGSAFSRMDGPKYVETKITHYALEMHSSQGYKRSTGTLRTPIYLSSFKAYLKLAVDNAENDDAFARIKNYAMSFRRLNMR